MDIKMTQYAADVVGSNLEHEEAFRGELCETGCAEDIDNYDIEKLFSEVTSLEFVHVDAQFSERYRVVPFLHDGAKRFD